MQNIMIKVSDFTLAPCGRYKSKSTNSGEEFRDDKLVPAFADASKVTVNLDGVIGYSSSFLEEAFGGLVRKMGWSSDDEINERISIFSERADWSEEVMQYMRDAVAQHQIRAQGTSEQPAQTANPPSKPALQSRSDAKTHRRVKALYRSIFKAITNSDIPELFVFKRYGIRRIIRKCSCDCLKFSFPRHKSLSHVRLYHSTALT